MALFLFPPTFTVGAHYFQYQTPRNIQTLSNHCNLPKAAHTHIHTHTHTHTQCCLSTHHPPHCEISPSISASPSAAVSPCSLCSARLTAETSGVSVQRAGPDTFALLFSLSTVAVRDLPAFKDHLLDKGTDCRRKYDPGNKTSCT